MILPSLTSSSLQHAPNSPALYLGVDVSKAHLDVAGLDPNVRRLLNTPASIAALLKRLPPGAHLVLEATGGYERPLTDACHHAGIASSVLNPARVRHFANATGRLAKNDSIDASLLAQFGAALHPPADPAPNPHTRQLAELVSARDQLVAVRIQLSNAFEHLQIPAVRQIYSSQLASLDRRIDKLAAAMAALLRECPALQARNSALQAHCGVGPLVAATLLAHLPELGQANRGQIAALAGLAPYDRDSGQTRGLRSIRGGRPKVRRCLYLAALAVIRSKSSPLRPFYLRLRENGKPAKLALIATARKLLCSLNFSLKNLPA